MTLLLHSSHVNKTNLKIWLLVIIIVAVDVCFFFVFCFPAIRSMSTARADVESFVRGGPTLTMFFLVDGEREDPNTTKVVHHLRVNETPFNGVSLAGR